MGADPGDERLPNRTLRVTAESVHGLDAVVHHRPLPLDAYTGHAGAVTAFICDTEATRSSHETADQLGAHRPHAARALEIARAPHEHYQMPATGTLTMHKNAYPEAFEV